VLDSNGRCVHVLSGDDSVFGFSPTELLGAALGDFIDAFKVCLMNDPPQKCDDLLALHTRLMASVVDLPMAKTSHLCTSCAGPVHQAGPRQHHAQEASPTAR
jgi:hypothetical protein